MLLCSGGSGPLRRPAAGVSWWEGKHISVHQLPSKSHWLPLLWGHRTTAAPRRLLPARVFPLLLALVQSLFRDQVPAGSSPETRWGRPWFRCSRGSSCLAASWDTVSLGSGSLLPEETRRQGGAQLVPEGPEHDQGGDGSVQGETGPQTLLRQPLEAPDSREQAGLLPCLKRGAGKWGAGTRTPQSRKEQKGDLGRNLQPQGPPVIPVLGEVSSRDGLFLNKWGQQLPGSGRAGSTPGRDRGGRGSRTPVRTRLPRRRSSSEAQAMCVLGAHTSPKWGPPHGSVSLRNREAGPHEDPLQGPGATHPQGLSLRVPPRQGPPHRWGPGPAVLPASGKGHTRAGSCSLGPSVGGRPPQTAACGGAVRTDRSLWGGAGSGPAATARGPHQHLCRSTGDPGGPPAHGCSTAPRVGPSNGQPLLAKAPWSRLCFLGSSAKRGPR